MIKFACDSPYLVYDRQNLSGTTFDAFNQYNLTVTVTYGCSEQNMSTADIRCIMTVIFQMTFAPFPRYYA